jgi:hypothetical protein
MSRWLEAAPVAMAKGDRSAPRSLVSFLACPGARALMQGMQGNDRGSWEPARCATRKANELRGLPEFVPLTQCGIVTNLVGSKSGSSVRCH